jgi:hypothetical protein
VIHGGRGRRAHNRIAAEVRARLLKLQRGKYAGFNDQHFQEKLVEVEGLVVSRATVAADIAGGGHRGRASAPARTQGASRTDGIIRDGRQSRKLSARPSSHNRRAGRKAL